MIYMDRLVREGVNQAAHTSDSSNIGSTSMTIGISSGYKNKNKNQSLSKLVS
jgi:hypothetical protein